jgi:phytoene dehydrogenase-like protein
VLERISKVLEVDIKSLIETEDILTPPEIQSRTSSMGGALYGTSSNDRMAAFLRHSNKSKDVKGLYFCGGSVHPGGGIPLCLLSGKIAAEWIGEDE